MALSQHFRSQSSAISSRPDSPAETRALQDAWQMQESVSKECSDLNIPLPRFQLDEFIGEGVFGRVYKATDPCRRQTVAIKIIRMCRSDGSDSPPANLLTEIHKEVNTLKLLNSHNAASINPIIDTLIIGDSIWVISEYCTVGSVATLMVPFGGLAEEWAVPILREAAEAVRWIHGRSVIHGDIKCSNLLVSTAGKALLCDFAVASMVDELSRSGTLRHDRFRPLAPEMMTSQAQYGAKVDVWGLGLTAYEMTCGYLPDPRGVHDSLDEASSTKEGDLQQPFKLHGSRDFSLLRDMIVACTAKDPIKRPSIEQVQDLPYLANTSARYPSSNILDLVSVYRTKSTDTDNNCRRPPPDADPEPSRAEQAQSGTAVDDDRGISTAANDFISRPRGSDALDAREAQGPPISPAMPRTRHNTGDTQPKPEIPSTPIESVFDQKAPSSYLDSAAHSFLNLCAPLPLNESPTRNLSVVSAPPQDGEKLVSILSAESRPDAKQKDLLANHPIAKGWTFASALKDAAEPGNQGQSQIIISRTDEPISPKTRSFVVSRDSSREAQIPVDSKADLTGLAARLDDLDAFLLEEQPPQPWHVARERALDPDVQNRLSTMTLIDWYSGEEDTFGKSQRVCPIEGGSDADQLGHSIRQEEPNYITSTGRSSQAVEAVVEDWLEKSWEPGLLDTHRSGLNGNTRDNAQDESSLIGLPPLLTGVRSPLGRTNSTPALLPSFALQSQGNLAVSSRLSRCWEDQEPIGGDVGVVSSWCDGAGSAHRLEPPRPLPPSTTAAMGISSRENCIAELTRLLSSLNEHLQYASDPLRPDAGNQRGLSVRGTG